MLRRILITAVSVAAACSEPAAKVEYAPYEGPAAYPDRRPKLPAAKGYFGYVSDSLSDTISVLDLPSNEVVLQIPVGRDPIDIDGPHHLAVDPGGTVYVALSYPAPATLPGPHAAHSSSTRPGYVLKLAADDLRTLAAVQTDPNPGEIVLAPGGSRLVVTHFDLGRAVDVTKSPDEQRATIAIVDPQTMAPPVLVKVCRAPHGASISSDDKTAFVACYADDAIGIVDLASASGATTLVPVGGKGPYSAVLSPSGKRVAVGNTDSRDTRVLDVETRTMTPFTAVTQGAPYFAAWSADDKDLWIPTQGPDALVLVDGASGATRRLRLFDAATCDKPHEAQLAKDGATLYVVCEGDHKTASVVLALDPATLETRASMKVGTYPDRLAWRRGP
jgi:YVTN family beta-propeller protein